MSSAHEPKMLYRIVWPAEVKLLEAHLIRLAPEDRKMRFCGMLNDEAIQNYCDKIEWSKTTKLGCFIDGVLRGVADIVLMPSNYRYDAELAITVEKSYQNQGIGTALLRKSLDVARNRFIRTAHLYCLRDNVKMCHIAKKFEGNLIIDGSDVEGKLSTPWPSYQSLVEEAMLNGQAIWSATFTAAMPPRPLSAL